MTKEIEKEDDDKMEKVLDEFMDRAIKAETDWLIDYEVLFSLKSYGQQEATAALQRKDRDQYQFWQGWNAALERVETSLSRMTYESK